MQSKENMICISGYWTTVLTDGYLSYLRLHGFLVFESKQVI